MSFSRENVIWQSENKTWNIGFWSFYQTGDPFDEDYDPEWDVEYSNDSFWFLSTGHANPDAASDAYARVHSNPGGHWIVEYGDETAADIAKYEQYAWEFKNPEAAERARVEKFEAERAIKHATIIAEFDANNISNFSGIEYAVTRQPSYNWAKMTTTDRAVLGADGWVSVGGKPVYNPGERKFAADVIDFKRQQTTRSYGYGYGRY